MFNFLVSCVFMHHVHAGPTGVSRRDEISWDCVGWCACREREIKFSERTAKCSYGGAISPSLYMNTLISYNTMPLPLVELWLSQSWSREHGNSCSHYFPVMWQRGQEAYATLWLSMPEVGGGPVPGVIRAGELAPPLICCSIWESGPYAMLRILVELKVYLWEICPEDDVKQEHCLPPPHHVKAWTCQDKAG